MVEYRGMLVGWWLCIGDVSILVCQGTEKSVVVCSGQLPATIFIGMGPNLATTCISEMSIGTFLDFLKF